LSGGGPIGGDNSWVRKLGDLGGGDEARLNRGQPAQAELPVGQKGVKRETKKGSQ